MYTEMTTLGPYNVTKTILNTPKVAQINGKDLTRAKYTEMTTLGLNTVI